MNWKLIFQLSLFGLAMAIATVFWIPSNTERYFWIVILVICAYLIARNCKDKFFLHGLFLGLVNSIWITLVHVLLFNSYMANHQKEADMMATMPLPTHPRILMLLIGPLVGLISGLVLGLFAFIASKIWKNQPPVKQS